jgi:hypothetical protein
MFIEHCIDFSFPGRLDSLRLGERAASYHVPGGGVPLTRRRDGAKGRRRPRRDCGSVGPTRHETMAGDVTTIMNKAGL